MDNTKTEYKFWIVELDVNSMITTVCQNEVEALIVSAQDSNSSKKKKSTQVPLTVPSHIQLINNEHLHVSYTMQGSE